MEAMKKPMWKKLINNGFYNVLVISRCPDGRDQVPLPEHTVSDFGDARYYRDD